MNIDEFIWFIEESLLELYKDLKNTRDAETVHPCHNRNSWWSIQLLLPSIALNIIRRIGGIFRIFKKTTILNFYLKFFLGGKGIRRLDATPKCSRRDQSLQFDHRSTDKWETTTARENLTNDQVANQKQCCRCRSWGCPPFYSNPTARTGCIKSTATSTRRKIKRWRVKNWGKHLRF